MGSRPWPRHAVRSAIIAMIAALTASLLVSTTVFFAPGASADAADVASGLFERGSSAGSMSSDTVRPSITLSASAVRVRAGHRVALTGSVSLLPPGYTVSIEARRGRSWHVVDSPTLHTDRTFRGYAEPPTGTSRYRATTRGFGDAAAAASNGVTVVGTAVDPARPVAVNGDARIMEVTRAGRVATATFAANVGDRLTLALTENTFGTLTTSRIAVRDARGRMVPLTDNGSSDRPRRTFTAPASGRYTVRINPVGAETGRVVLHVSTPAAFSISTNAEARRLTTRGIAGRELWVGFRATAGDVLTLRTTNTSDWVARSRLVDSATGRELDQFAKIPTDGTYRFEIVPDSTQRLAADVEVLSNGTGVATLDRSMTATVERADQILRWSVEVPRATSVSIAVSDAELTNGYASVELQSVYPSASSREYGVVHSKVLQPGTYTLTALVHGGGTGSFRIDLSTPVERSGVLDGPAVDATTDGLRGRAVATTFSARAGQIVFNDAVGSTGYVFDQLIDVASGERLDQSWSNGYDAWTIPATGTYRFENYPSRAVAVTSPARVRSVPVRSLAVNERTAVTFDEDDVFQAFEFTADRDERLTLAVARATSTDYAIGARGDEPGHRFDQRLRRSAIEVRRGQTYTVLLYAGHRAGSLDLHLGRALVERATPNGDPVTLTTEDVPGRDLEATFEATAGDVISFHLSAQQGWNIYPVTLVPTADEDSEPASQLDRDYRTADPVWLVRRSGTYRLRFSPQTVDLAAAKVAVRRTRVTPTTAGDPGQQLSVDRPGGVAVMEVDPCAPGDLRVTASPTTFSENAVVPLVVPYLSGGEMLRMLTSRLAPVTGSLYAQHESERFLVLLNPAGDATGSAVVTVERS